MISTKSKIGLTQFGLATSFIIGPYFGTVANASSGLIIKITTNPSVLASASSIGTVAAKYGPDAINFAYGLMTGDALEPIPTNTGNQFADASSFLRSIFRSPVNVGGWLKAAGVTDATFIKRSIGGKSQ